jgi:hypothetical protein
MDDPEQMDAETKLKFIADLKAVLAFDPEAIAILNEAERIIRKAEEIRARLRPEAIRRASQN